MIALMKPPNYSKHILFITSSRIGDAVLSAGVLNELSRQHPDAGFTIACGSLVTTLFEGFPQAEQIIPLKKQKYNRHWLDLWKKTVGTRYEVVVDLRNSAVSRLLLSRKRYIFGGHIDQKQHKVVQNASVIGMAKNPPAPRLWLTEKQRLAARDLIPDGTPVLGVGPTANWIGKTWPVERFIEVVRWMRAENGLMPNARVAIFAAPGEEENARILLDTIPEGFGLDVIAKTDPGTAAACLARCSYYLGNDSGLMHCAAAAGVPTFGLFGPSYPHLYSPWGKHTAYISTPETFDELTAYEGYTPQTAGCLMTSLTVESVKAQIEKSWPLLTSSS